MKIELKATPDNALHFTRFLTAAGIQHEVKLIETNEIAIALVLNEVDFKTVKVKQQQPTRPVKSNPQGTISFKDNDLDGIWTSTRPSKPMQLSPQDIIAISLKDKDLATIWSLLIEELLNEDLLKNVMNIKI